MSGDGSGVLYGPVSVDVDEDRKRACDGCFVGWFGMARR